MIALICEKKEQERLKMLLSEFGDVEMFKEGISFAFCLPQGGLCRLAVVANDAFRETVKQILARGG